MKTETARLHFRCDAWNRLAQVWEDSNANNYRELVTDGVDKDTLLATYRRDGLHRRIVKLLGEDPGDPDVQYDVYYNTSWQAVEIRKDETAEDANTYKEYVWDIRYIDAAVVRFFDGNTDGDLLDAGDNTLYYCQDANFNVTALVDAYDGAVRERYMYDPYGRVTVLHGESGQDPDIGGESEWDEDENGTDWANELLYCGYRYDPETGLYHVRHRPYDVLTGRWLTRDTYPYGHIASLYEYCLSDPTNAGDAWGEKATKVTLEKGVHAVVEVLPQQGVSELKVIQRGTELFRMRYDLADETLEVVLKHGGRDLPGASKTLMKKIAPKLSRVVTKMVRSTGGRVTKKIGQTVFRNLTRGIGGAAVGALLIVLTDASVANAATNPRGTVDDWAAMFPKEAGECGACDCRLEAIELKNWDFWDTLNDFLGLTFDDSPPGIPTGKRVMIDRHAMRNVSRKKCYQWQEGRNFELDIEYGEATEFQGDGQNYWLGWRCKFSKD